MAKNKNTKYGLFYKSHGKWTKTPYDGMTFTAHQAKRNPIKKTITFLKNYILKNKVRIRQID